MAMTVVLAGPECKNCRQTEQRCAYLAGCCALCTHDFGADKPVGRPPRRAEPTTIAEDFQAAYGTPLADAERPQLERWLADLRRATCRDRASQ